MGFDDHKWLTDDDLTQLVQFGDSEALDLEAESAHLGKAILKCGPQDEGKRKGLENECRRKDEKSHRIRTLLKAYVDEKKRRGL